MPYNHCRSFAPRVVRQGEGAGILSSGQTGVCLLQMAHELDDIRAQTDCPVCGGELNVTYKTMRLERTVECPTCGETVQPIDDTPIGKIQKLIDEA